MMTTHFPANRLLSLDFFSFFLQVSSQKLFSYTCFKAFIFFSIAWFNESRGIFSSFSRTTEYSTNFMFGMPVTRGGSNVTSLGLTVLRVCDFVFSFPISMLSHFIVCSDPQNLHGAPENSNSWAAQYHLSSHLDWIRAFRLGVLVTLFPLPVALRSMCLDAIIIQNATPAKESSFCLLKYLVSSGIHFIAGFFTYSIARVSVEFLNCRNGMLSRTARRQMHLASFWRRRMRL